MLSGTSGLCPQANRKKVKEVKVAIATGPSRKRLIRRVQKDQNNPGMKSNIMRMLSKKKKKVVR